MELPTKTIQFAKDKINNLKNKLFREAYNDIKPDAKKDKKEEKKEGYEVQPKSPIKVKAKVKTDKGFIDAFINSFTQTFVRFLFPALLFFVCTLAGSIAANDAINRSPLVRFVYFIYGSVPIFTPIVLIYYIVRYFMDTYPVWYNFLPLTTYQPESRFMQILLKPFVYTNDANIQYKFKQFLNAAKPMLLEPSSVDKIPGPPPAPAPAPVPVPVPVPQAEPIENA